MRGDAATSSSLFPILLLVIAKILNVKTFKEYYLIYVKGVTALNHKIQKKGDYNK